MSLNVNYCKYNYIIQPKANQNTHFPIEYNGMPIERNQLKNLCRTGADPGF